MIITAAKVAFKLGRSKTARKVARKVVETARENVTIDTAERAVEIEAAGRTFRIDRDTFKRDRSAEAATQTPELTPFDEDWYR